MRYGTGQTTPFTCVIKNTEDNPTKKTNTESHFSDLAGLFFLIQMDDESKDNHKKNETYTGLDQANASSKANRTSEAL